METSPDLSSYLPVQQQLHRDLRRAADSTRPGRRGLARFAHPSFLVSVGLAAALTLGPLAACGSDAADTADGAVVVTTSRAPTTTPATTPATTSAAASTSTAETTAETTPDTASMDSMHHHMGGDAGAPVDNGDGVLDIVANEYTFTVESQTVGAGLVPVRMTNAGSEAHQVQIGRAPAGVDADVFVQTYESAGEKAAFDLLTWEGGVNAVPAGATAEATANLEPGDYLVVCFFPAPDGTSHVMKHMIAPLHVVDEHTPAAAAPTADEVVTMQDYSITLPPGFRGNGTVAFSNLGQETHEVTFIRLEEGKTLADAAAYQAAPSGPPPFTFAGGISSIAPGTTEYAKLALKPGSYIATCFVPGPGGAPHAAMGMVATFDIS